MIESAILWTGVVLSGLGLISIAWPVRFLGIRTRGGGAIVFASGIVLIGVGCLLPARETRLSVADSRLDEFTPRWQFDELHSIRVEAPPERVFEAIEKVSASEIPLFRTLTAIRRFGRRGPENILNPPEREPLLDVATRTSFLVLAREAPSEIVIGTIVVLPEGKNARTLLAGGSMPSEDQPGLGLAFMNFRVLPEDAKYSRVTTETRVIAGDPATARKFAIYWRVIYPGSALIRFMWLRAIQRRAEGLRTAE